MTSAVAQTGRAATSPRARPLWVNMRRPLALAAALAIASLAPAAAHAATWPAPQTISQPHTFAGPLLTAAAPGGGAFVAWPWQDNVGNDAVGGASGAGRAADAFTPEQTAPDGLVDVEPYGTGQVLGLAAQGLPGRSGATGAILYRLKAAVGAIATGRFGVARTIATAPVIGRPRLATASGSSTALITWIEVTKTSSGAIRRVVRAVERRGGRYGAPSTLSGRGRADTLTAAANAGGDQVVAFVRQGDLLARVRRAGHGWGAIQRLARATGATQWQLVAGVTDRGQIRVVWRRHQLRTADAPGRTALESSALLIGRSRFTAAQTLTPDGVSATFRLLPIADGWAVATVETTPEGPRPALHRTPMGGGSRFAPVVFAAPAQGGIRAADAVFDVGLGAITVAWIQPLPGQDGDGQARAAALAGGSSAFGPVEDVSPPEAVHEVALLAAPPALGRPVAVWTARPQGTGPSIPTGQIRTLVRTARRQP